MAKAFPRASGPAVTPELPEIATTRVGSSVRSLIRLMAYLLITVILMPAQAVVLLLGARSWQRIPMWYHRLCGRLLGFHLDIQGAMTGDRPALFVSNHSSYLDITILGSIIPASFVAKSEVAGWPLFGWLAKLQRTVFVDRRRRTTHNQRDEMARRLDAGDSLILFPEGTSDDGNRILPFRSALFSVAERMIEPSRHLTVQPVSLAYTHLNGVPLGRAYRPFLAWYGDMSLFSHLWTAAGLGKVTVRVNFHDPIDLARFGSRKALSAYCQDQIAAGLAGAISGRAAGLRP
jgi:1-acyl-sn-glycerol-3-phosphate acyltransferase